MQVGLSPIIHGLASPIVILHLGYLTDFPDALPELLGLPHLSRELAVVRKKLSWYLPYAGLLCLVGVCCMGLLELAVGSGGSGALTA